MRQECGVHYHECVINADVHPDFRERLSRCTPGHMRDIMSQATPFAVEEHVHGDTVWVAVRSRGADWSWLTPQEAVELGRAWIAKYGPAPQAAE
jgi:hypothetical protein